VTGLAAVPQTKGFHLGGQSRPGEGWQPVWQYLDLDVFARTWRFRCNQL